MDHNLENYKHGADGVVDMHGEEGEEPTVSANKNICFIVEVYPIVFYGDGDERRAEIYRSNVYNDVVNSEQSKSNKRYTFPKLYTTALMDLIDGTEDVLNRRLGKNGT